MKMARRREVGRAEKVLLTIRLPERDYEALERYVREGRFINVSEAIRAAVKLLIWSEGRAVDVVPRAAKEGAAEEPAVAGAESAGG
jgi:Arc/MetJ-type ribon-helix-helix transcriptional regulator